MAVQIHIVEDDLAFGKMLTAFLERRGFEISISHSGSQGRKVLEENTFDFLITDLKLPDDSGLELLEYTKKISPQTKVILMTGYAEVDTAVKAIKKGALDYISKPFRPEELLMIIEDASKNQGSVSEAENEFQDNLPVSKPISEKPGFIVGISEI